MHHRESAPGPPGGLTMRLLFDQGRPAPLRHHLPHLPSRPPTRGVGTTSRTGSCSPAPRPKVSTRSSPRIRTSVTSKTWRVEGSAMISPPSIVGPWRTPQGANFIPPSAASVRLVRPPMTAWCVVRWLSQFNRSFTVPTPEQVSRFESALRERGHLLGESVREQLWFSVKGF